MGNPPTPNFMNNPVEIGKKVVCENLGLIEEHLTPAGDHTVLDSKNFGGAHGVDLSRHPLPASSLAIDTAAALGLGASFGSSVIVDIPGNLSAVKGELDTMCHGKPIALATPPVDRKLGKQIEIG